MRSLPVSFGPTAYRPQSGQHRFGWLRSRLQARGRGEKCRESGFSLIELLIVVAIILIILAIALPQVNKIQMNAREMAAVAQIRTLLTAQTQYMSQFGRYATSLTELGPAAGGATEGPSAAGLIPQSLATGANSGYNFTMTGSAGGYAVLAVPVAFNNTGRRTFFADQSGIIHENWGQEPATPQSPEIK